MPFDMSIHVERHTSRLERAPRTGRACGLCHTRKVKCDIGPTKPQCSNCQRDGHMCELRPQQRKSHAHRVKTKASAYKGPAHITASKPTDTSDPLPASSLSTTHHGILWRGETVMSLQGDGPQSPPSSISRRMAEKPNQPQDQSPSAVSD